MKSGMDIILLISNVRSLLIGTNSVDFALYAAVCAFLVHKCINQKIRRTTRKTHIVLVLYLTCLLVAIPWVIGKQYIFPPFERGIHPHQGRCCSQANVFRNGETVDQLVEYMKSNAGKSFYDYLLDKVCVLRTLVLTEQFAKKFEKKIYLVVPNLFQHTGIISSYDENSSNYKYLHLSWNFEENET